MSKFKVGDRIRNVSDTGDLRGIPLGYETALLAMGGYALHFLDVDGARRARSEINYGLVTPAGRDLCNCDLPLAECTCHPFDQTPPRQLTTNSAARKGLPIATGVLDYFPDALAEIARLSKAGNDKHNPGEPLHWSRDKSTDHADCIIRHMLDRGTLDDDGFLHEVKVAWRALAQLQVALEQRRQST